MEAAAQACDGKKQELLQQLAELLVEEQRDRGTFQSVPHYSVLEQAARALGQEVSRAAQARAMAEVAATAKATAACPTCGQQHSVAVQKRRVTSVDGPVELLEPVAHCPACRRDFFPSA